MILTRRQAISSLGTALVTASCLAGSTRPAVRTPTATSAASGDFLRAVQRGDLPRVRRMLAADKALARSVDEVGRSALVLAHLAGHWDVAKALQATGLDLDIVEATMAEDWQRFDALARAHPEQLNRAHPVGGTPIYAAALVGSLDFWRLRGVGCDPDAAPQGGTGFTPARGAMEGHNIDHAQIAVTDLLSNGGDVHAVQRHGDSILHGAVRRRSETLVRLVIRKGAVLDVVDAENRTPVDLATQIGWDAGVKLLADLTNLPKDNRASRFVLDANQQPIIRPDLSDVSTETQSQVTSASHARLKRVRQLVAKDERLVFAISSDDELAIEASAHMGNRPLMRFHLDHGAPLSLPTAVSLGDRKTIAYWLRRDPTLAHERGAHDFPVMWYTLLGRGGPEIAELLADQGLSVDQHSMGTTTLHWCAVRENCDLATWLIEQGADIEAVGFKWDRNGQTPLQVAQTRKSDKMAKLLRDAGARR